MPLTGLGGSTCLRQPGSAASCVAATLAWFHPRSASVTDGQPRGRYSNWFGDRRTSRRRTARMRATKAAGTIRLIVVLIFAMVTISNDLREDRGPSAASIERIDR